MDLGALSISLTVKDLGASRRFYETLGFEAIDGDEELWAMLRNGNALVGLFQGMFDENMLTFNPPDVRAIEAALADAGYQIAANRWRDGTGSLHGRRSRRQHDPHRSALAAALGL